MKMLASIGAFVVVGGLLMVGVDVWNAQPLPLPSKIILTLAIACLLLDLTTDWLSELRKIIPALAVSVDEEGAE